jgi:tetratricopeptide (TPR) repeat protein
MMARRMWICAWLLAVAGFAWSCSGSGRRGSGEEDRVYSHTVKPGETLTEIADDYYGDPSRARALIKFNDLDTDQVRPGAVIRIPMDGKDVAHLKTREMAREPYNRGLAMVEGGAYLDAVQQFQESLEIDPDFVDARYNLGVTLQKMKSYDKAIDQFKQAIRARPEEPAYHFALGNAYFHLERYQDAAACFDEVMERDGAHLKAQYSLAMCYEKMGENDMARRAWQRYLELDGDSAWATEARKRLNSLK